MISCKCLNVVVRLAPEAATEPAIRFDLDAYLAGRKPVEQRPESASTPTPSDDHFLFFKEALGPVRCSSVDVRFDGLLRTVRLFNDWDLSQCRNCACCVFARLAPECANNGTSSYLVNSTLMTNEEQLSARMADANYSAAFGLVLNGSGLTYSDLADKAKLLAKAKSDNRFVQMLRAYMEHETEAANERIQRFTEQEFAVLKVKRERAEQDCLVLAKLAHNVPELLRLATATESSSNTVTGTSSGTAIRRTTPPVTTVTSTTRVSSGTTTTTVTANSQLETPPPTPEYLPMSTGNSPPMRIRNGGTNAITPPSSADHSAGPTPQRPAAAGLASSRSFNNNNGRHHHPQHSSTNSTTAMQLHRIAANSSIEDCMFDIDGMEENADKSPLSNTLSDEEELGFDDTIGNNNDDGIYIPSRALGRQNSSIAKSLPISMPQVMTQFRANEEDYEEMTEDNVDIAASIKALARSVHGDTVFGDLPRPQVQRFSTQI